MPPAIAVPLAMGALGLGTGLLGAKKKSSDTFDKRKEFGFFESPEQRSMREGLDDQASGINRAMTGSFGGTYEALAREGQKFATGDYLDYDDPANQKFISATTKPMERVFKEQTMPDVLSMIARGRGVGGERGDNLFRQTYRDYTESVGDVSSRALSGLAAMRTGGFQAAGSTMAGLTDSATRLNALRASLLPVLQVIREFGTGTQTSAPSGQEQGSSALLNALVMFGGAKSV